MRFGLGVGVSKLTGVKGVPGKLIGVARGTGAFRGGLTQSLKGSVSSSALVAGVLSKKVALIGALTAATAFGGALTAGSAAALDLPFSTMSAGSDLTTKGVTFTRSGLATQYDSTGKLTYAPNNLFIQSNNPSSWGLNNAASITNAAGTGPFGANDAVQVTLGTTNYLYQSVNFGAGVRHIVSAYVKGTAGQKVLLRFDMSGTDVDTPVTFDGTWQRVSIYGTPSSTSGLVGFDNRSSVGSAGANGIGSSSVTFLFGGMQFEAVTYQTTPRPYVATTSAAYYGPRFDYDPATLAAKGLLIEEARTNLLLWSKDYTNAVWVSNGVTLTANRAGAPDGTATTTRIQMAAAVQSVNYLNQLISGSFDSQTHIGALFVRSTSGAAQTFSLKMTQAGVADHFSPDITVSGASWQRVSAAQTFAAGGSGAYVGIASGVAGAAFDIEIWNMDFNANASFITSYIPTASASVTRPMEACYIQGTSVSSKFNGGEMSMFIEAMPVSTNSTMDLIAISDASFADGIEWRLDNGVGPRLRKGDGSGDCSSFMASYNGAPFFIKMAGAAKANDFELLTVDPAGPTFIAKTDTSTSALAADFDWIDIGCVFRGAQSSNCWIKRVIGYNTRKSTAEMTAWVTS